MCRNTFVAGIGGMGVRFLKLFGCVWYAGLKTRHKVSRLNDEDELWIFLATCILKSYGIKYEGMLIGWYGRLVWYAGLKTRHEVSRLNEEC